MSATLVQLDAEVTDLHQSHVADLRAEDFEVLLDRKIPDLKKVHLALTTPIVSEDSIADSSDNDASAVLREFHAGSNLSFVSMLETDRYETAKLPTRDFAAHIQLYSDGKQVLNAPVPVREVQGRNVHALKTEICLNHSLPAGQYYLEANVTDRGRQDSALDQHLGRFPNRSLGVC